MRERKIAITMSNVLLDGNQVTAHVELPASQLNGARGVLYIALAGNRDESQVSRGENAGRSLGHVGVIRVLKQIGTLDLESASSRDVTISVQRWAAPNGMRLVTFLQDPRSGHILGVAAQKL